MTAKQQIKTEEIKDRLEAELAAKGLILLKSDTLPSRHGGIIRRFSELYIKTEILEKEIGKNLHYSLDLRNKARYVPKAKITKEDAEIVLGSAKNLIDYLGNKIK